MSSVTFDIMDFTVLNNPEHPRSHAGFSIQISVDGTPLVCIRRVQLIQRFRTGEYTIGMPSRKEGTYFTEMALIMDSDLKQQIIDRVLAMHNALKGGF